MEADFLKNVSKFFFWYSKLASGEIVSYWLRFKDQIWVRNFDENFFFEKKFYVHWMNAHMFCIIQRLWKTSKIVFQSVISTWKESTWSENSSKISGKFQIGVRNFDEIFFHQYFSVIHSNVKNLGSYRRILRANWIERNEKDTGRAKRIEHWVALESLEVLNQVA